MPQGGIWPEHALGCNAVAILAYVHGKCPAKEVLDFIAFRVRSNPAWPADSGAADDKGREMLKGNIIEVG